MIDGVLSTYELLRDFEQHDGKYSRHNKPVREERIDLHCILLLLLLLVRMRRRHKMLSTH